MSTELTKLEAPQATALAEILDSGMTSDDIELPVTKIPSGGGLMWEIPNGTPEPDYVKELVGVVIADYAYDTFFTESYNDDPDARPQAIWVAGQQVYCTPEAVKAGIIEGEPTAAQPLNQFGTKGAGKAIDNKWRIFLAQPDNMFPLQVNISVMSRKPWSTFRLHNLVGKQPYSKIVELSLTKATNAAGTDYAKLVPTLKGDVPADQIEAFATYAEQVKSLTTYAVPPQPEADGEGVAAVKEAFEAEDVKADSIPF